MKCKFSRLEGDNVRYLWLVALLGTVIPGCGHPTPAPTEIEVALPTPKSLPSLPTKRIAIVGASVSAGFGGAPFGDLFVSAAKASSVESYANIFLFRDPIAETRSQIAKAISFRADSIVALDLLFWDIYGSTEASWRDAAIASALAELERARIAGSWIILGDVPRITTASEMLIAKEHVPDASTIAHYNETIRTWSRRERVLLVPFAAWAAPLAAGGNVEVTPGEIVPASTLVGPDGLHVNALGAWALLDRLDHFIEKELPGTPKGALVFVRPSAP